MMHYKLSIFVDKSGLICFFIQACELDSRDSNGLSRENSNSSSGSKNWQLDKVSGIPEGLVLFWHGSTKQSFCIPINVSFFTSAILCSRRQLLPGSGCKSDFVVNKLEHGGSQSLVAGSSQYPECRHRPYWADCGRCRGRCYKSWTGH